MPFSLSLTINWHIITKVYFLKKKYWSTYVRIYQIPDHIFWSIYVVKLFVTKCNHRKLNFSSFLPFVWYLVLLLYGYMYITRNQLIIQLKLSDVKFSLKTCVLLYSTNVILNNVSLFWIPPRFGKWYAWIYIYTVYN